MAEKFILLVLFLANTVLSNPVSNKTCEASENCRGVGAMGRVDITSEPFYDDNPKKEKSWEVFDYYYMDGGTTLEGWDQDTSQPFYYEEYPDDDNPQLEESWEAPDDYMAGETTSQGWDTNQLIYGEDNPDDDNPNFLASLLGMFVGIGIVVMILFSLLYICICRKNSLYHERQLVEAKKKTKETLAKTLEDLKKEHGSNPKIMQQIKDIENHGGPLNFSTDPKDSKANPSLDSIAMIKAANREKNDASMLEEDGKGVNVKAGKASDAVHQGPSDVTNGHSSIDAATPTSNTLVCEFCSDKPFSLESLERHILSVHGILGDQSTNNLEKFETFSSSNSSVVTSSSASSTKTIQYSCRFNSKQGAVYLAARQSKTYPAPTPEHQKVLNTGIAMEQVKTESTLHFPPINAAKSCYVIDIPDKPETRNSKQIQ